ncbi:MAG: DMT family transporter [Treponema sp.]|nr:DMT family transporter [Spirochaetia bacterium]MDD7459451.1 DMT family transporter [Spirochaetales bacterium]MDY5810560.1 DMT family transporter [Treponema sp.]MEE1181039.1 DMT family transporter [Treponema sp.]
MKNSNLKFIFSAALIMTAAIWGFAFVIVKDSLNYIGPTWMVGIRFVIAAVCLSLIFIPRFKKLDKSTFLHGCLLGVFLFTAYETQTIGCSFTTAGKNAFLTTIYVILVPLLGWPVFKKKPQWFVWIAALLSVTGIALLALNGETGRWYLMNKGDVLTLVCGFFYAVHIIAGAFFVKNEDVVLLTVFQFFVSGILGLIIAPFADAPLDLTLFTKSNVVVSLLYLGLLSTMVAFLLQNLGLKYVPSSLASLFLSLESVFGVLFSCLVLGEHLTLKMASGCVLIFAAIVMAEVVPELFKKDKEPLN